jgi:lysylphosphatidylglycerol synthetase-like protein (DUF2156 family)
VITKKISKPAGARSAAASRAGTRSAVARPRPRTHPLAPEHIGEVGSVAVLAEAILGLSLFIAGIAVLISGITAGSRYIGDAAPPNVATLGLPQILGGAGLIVLSLAMVLTALGVLADVRHSRLAAAIVSGIAAVLSIGGVVWVMSQPGADQLFAGALAVVALTSAATAIILGRPRRRAA